MPTGYPFCYSEGTCEQLGLVIMIVFFILIVFGFIIALISCSEEKHRKPQ